MQINGDISGRDKLFRRYSWFHLTKWYWCWA